MATNLSSETVHTRIHINGIFQVLRELSTLDFISNKTSENKGGRNKNFFRQKLIQLMTSRSTLQEILKEVLQAKGKNNTTWKFGLYKGINNGRNDSYVDKYKTDCFLFFDFL